MRRRGFTLLELTFVIGIIAVLAAILFPIFANSRETARRAKCASNMQQIGMALNMYAHDYDGHFPKKNNEFGPIYRYSSCVDVFYCPSDAEEPYWDIRCASKPGQLAEFATPLHTYSSYVYKGGMCNDDRADSIIAGEFKILHSGLVNVLYLGGYVKSVSGDDYKPVVAPTQKPVSKKHTEESPGPVAAPGAPAPSAPAPGAAPAPAPAAEPTPDK